MRDGARGSPEMKIVLSILVFIIMNGDCASGESGISDLLLGLSSSPVSPVSPVQGLRSVSLPLTPGLLASLPASLSDWSEELRDESSNITERRQRPRLDPSELGSVTVDDGLELEEFADALVGVFAHVFTRES